MAEGQFGYIVNYTPRCIRRVDYDDDDDVRFET